MGPVEVGDRSEHSNSVASNPRSAGTRPESSAKLSPAVWFLALLAPALHLLVNVLAAGRYGFFRDELYYAACGEHLAWGYVDHAPLIAVVARLSRVLFGDSLVALRAFPALAAGLTVLVAAWMARELGGGHSAGLLAAVAVFTAPVYLTFDSFLSMNAFEPIFWTLCALLFVRIVRRNSPKLWLWVGVVAGLGVMNKHPLIFLASGLIVGMLLTSARREFASPWIWLGVLLSFAIFLPNLVWEWRHAWPTLEILRIVAQTVNAPVTPLQFAAEQVLLTGPLAAPIWIGGLWFLLRAQEAKLFRALGWAYLVVLAEFILLGGKIYYLAPFYPILLAAGAVWLERLIEKRGLAWLRPTFVTFLLATEVVAAPLTMPILPVETTARYAAFWHVEDVQVEKLPSGKLPQLFAEMFGWEEKAATVARVYAGLSQEERSRCAILTYNYGEAGAVDYFGGRYGLPKAISAHNNYFLWGPRDYTGEVVISFGVPRKDLEAIWEEISQAATIVNQYAVPDETNLPVYVCRRPKMPLRVAWPQLKTYG